MFFGNKGNEMSRFCTAALSVLALAVGTAQASTALTTVTDGIETTFLKTDDGFGQNLNSFLIKNRGKTRACVEVIATSGDGQNVKERFNLRPGGKWAGTFDPVASNSDDFSATARKCGSTTVTTARQATMTPETSKVFVQ